MPPQRFDILASTVHVRCSLSVQVRVTCDFLVEKCMGRSGFINWSKSRNATFAAGHLLGRDENIYSFFEGQKVDGGGSQSIRDRGSRFMAPHNGMPTQSSGASSKQDSYLHDLNELRIPSGALCQQLRPPMLVSVIAHRSKQLWQVLICRVETQLSNLRSAYGSAERSQ